MALTYRFATDSSEYPRIARFLDSYWAKDHVYCRNYALFDWTFRKRNHWSADGFSFALAEDGKELAGILGGIPFTFNQFGASSPGIWIANYVISPDHRKGPVALQLLSMFRRPQFHPVVAFGINPATATIYRVLRGSVLPDIPRHFLVFRGAESRAAKLVLAAKPDWSMERARHLVERFTGAPPEVSPEASFCIPHTWNTVEWPAIAASTVGAARDCEYLMWRYRRHPVFEYRFVAVAAGKRSGLAVWRLETIHHGSNGQRAELDRIGRLVEFLPASVENAEPLLAAVLSEVHAQGAFGVDCYSYHGPTRHLLDSLGFRAMGGQPDDSAMPSRFQPLDGKGGNIHSAFFVHADVPECSLSLQCPWYWTKSDSDQDRPN
jgi:hypothetical protein